MNDKDRPAMYFPTMTTEELIDYADSYAITSLETELLERLKNLLDKES